MWFAQPIAWAGCSVCDMKPARKLLRNGEMSEYHEALPAQDKAEGFGKRW
jgi:hypothetical protein